VYKPYGLQKESWAPASHYGYFYPWTTT